MAFELCKRSNFVKLPAMRWAVKDLIVLGGITLLFGAPKNGKSFIALSMACSVQAGVPWCGFATRKLNALYVGAEGFFGLLRREAAWSKLHQVDVELNYLREAINFFDPSSVKTALVELRRQNFVPDLIVVDTLARSMVGGKESATEDMSKVFDLIDSFRRELKNEPTFIVVHHGTKDGFTYRGSSVIAATVDGAIEVKMEKADALTLSCPLGMKDAAGFSDFGVRLAPVSIETEEGAELVPVVKDRLGPMDTLNVPFDEVGRDEKLAFSVLAAVPSGRTWTNWFNATKEALGGKLGKSTFNAIRKNLEEVGKVKGGGEQGAVFQVVISGGGEPVPGPNPTVPTAPPKPVPGPHLKDGDREDRFLGGANQSRSSPGTGTGSNESCDGGKSVVPGPPDPDEIQRVLAEEKIKLLQRAPKG